MSNYYESSTLLAYLRGRQAQSLPLRLAIMDIDNTFSGERILVNNTRNQLVDLGYGVIFVSTRTEELMMSEKMYNESVGNYKFTRPVPHSGFRKEHFVYTRSTQIIPEGQLDPEIIIGSSGTQIYIKQPDGYVQDQDYTRSFGLPSDTWRDQVMKALAKQDPDQSHFSFATIEDLDAYREGRSDVAPPLYLVQVYFPSLISKNKLLRQLAEAKENQTFFYTDDSYPQQGRFKGYFTPVPSAKMAAVNHILKRVTSALGADISEFEILIAGDSYTDYSMGNHSGEGAKVTFLVAGGSRLTDIVTKQLLDFGGEPVDIWRSIKPEENPGYYRYETQTSGRTIILGDLAYHRTIAIETIAAYLNRSK